MVQVRMRQNDVADGSLLITIGCHRQTACVDRHDTVNHETCQMLSPRGEPVGIKCTWQ
jgi:hypothetical protein